MANFSIYVTPNWWPLNSETSSNFLVVPVTEAKDFTCIPEGILPLRAVMRLSHDLKAGRVFGHMGKYIWYRLIEATAGTHKNGFANRP
jgi:hypothetical protein